MKNKNTFDSSLIKTIRDRIKGDIRVNNLDIEITVQNGSVILAGDFDKFYRREAAIEIIRSTEGVTELIDESAVITEYFRSDGDLKTLIEKQIQSLPLSSGEWINVSVNDGIVKLDGIVFKPQLKAFAASDSWGLSGIQDCINLIEVRRSPITTTHQEPISFLATKTGNESYFWPYNNLISEF
jgi:osmotically-inducible protein OsmY